MSVGERIAELRTKADMTQGQLAKAMDVSRQAVSKWENDLSSPDTLNLIRLADLLDTDVEYLATGRHTVFRRPPVVIKTVETVEKVVEKPVIQIQEKIVERIVDKPVVQYVDRPVVHKSYRTKYIRKPSEFIIIGISCFLLGLAVGFLL